MNKGSLIYEDYISLKEDKQIIFNNNLYKNQIQPASIDLTISEECYEISSSFLSSKTSSGSTPQDLLKKGKNKKIVRTIINIFVDI